MFPDLLAARAATVSAALETALADLGTLPVHDAMRYAARGGKGLRGFLVIESAALFDVPGDRAVWAAAAIEAMHAYSLVHDDLPSMDDDDLRRGQPTVHVRWDEATAVLVGDALQTLAFELLSREATFVSLLGLDGARQRASDLGGEAEAALDVYGDRAENLRAAARFVIARVA